MITRTVKMLGWGTESSTAAITAILYGNTVFNGLVNLEEMTADNESEQTAPTLFTFEIPIDYVGTMYMKISVDNATVRFGQIVANYTEVGMGSITYSSGPDDYIDVAEYDADYVRDPRTNVTIDDEAQPQPDRKIYKGAWHWTVTPGSTLAHDLIVPRPGLLED